MGEILKTYDYDLALSFAGEDREYVQQCAEIFRSMGLNVFYDNYEKSILLGKNLYSYLGDIYKNKARFALIFVSAAYVSKRWTKHELSYICERSFEQDTEYLLPIRIDSTSLPELPSTIGYITAEAPIIIAEIIAKKLDRTYEIRNMLEYLRDYLEGYKIHIIGSNVEFISTEEDFTASYPLSFLMELHRLGLLFELFLVPAIVPH